MSESAFDGFTREAAARLSRRGSFATLGGAALAAGLAGPMTAEAKNPAQKVKKKNNQRCEQVREECRNLALGIPNPDVVSQAAFACCDNCFVGDFLTCLTTAIES
jgi:hypothetical protein